MVELSAEQFAQRAFDLNLLDERNSTTSGARSAAASSPAKSSSRFCCAASFLTNYQTERLLRGERTGFFYGDYKVLYLIGTGTFARVYRAVASRRPARSWPSRCCGESFSEDPEEADRFYREGTDGRHAHASQHRADSSKCTSEGDTHYLVMKFIEGRNLREFIKIRKKFEPVEDHAIMDVAAGLSYAFERGICHRDLKMSNVLVSSRGEAMLVDFGLAAAEDASGRRGESAHHRLRRAGTQPPVCARTTRSDIYFLGCIFYHMLTGQPPIVRDEGPHSAAEQDPVSKCRADHSGRSRRPRRRRPRGQQGHGTEPRRALSDARRNACRPQDGGLTHQRPADQARSRQAAAQPTVMVVESHTELQDVLRERLKNSGYRVLVLRDPDRAMQRFTENAKAADCVIFSTSVLGQTALEAFNRLASDKATQHIPAILLLAEHHAKWQSKATLDETHALVTMPIKIRQLRELVAKLLPADEVWPIPAPA